jgi:hypothetical protein
MTDQEVRALAARLHHAEARVRAIAAMDLSRADIDTFRAILPGIVGRLAAEQDERVALALVRVVRARGTEMSADARAEVRTVLTSLRARANSPQVSHEALLAHDTLERCE